MKFTSNSENCFEVNTTPNIFSMYVTATGFYITLNYLADNLILSNFQMRINLSHKSQNTQSANAIVSFLIKRL